MSGDWDAMADIWLDGTPSTLWRRHSDAVNLRLVGGWLGGNLGAVLKTDLFDEAVSHGLVAALSTRATSVTGIDINARVVETAQRRNSGLLTALVADVRALPFADGGFDTVISNSTLDHFDDPAAIEASLRELGRVLAPGGRLLVTLDNPRNPVIALGKALRGRMLNRAWKRAGARTARVGLVPYYVGATLATPELVGVLERSGLAVARTGFVVHAPRLAAVVVGSALQRRGGAASHDRFLAVLDACEHLGRTPARSFTGHFVAALAVRPSS